MSGIIGNGTTIELYTVPVADQGANSPISLDAQLIGVPTVQGSAAEAVDTTTMTDINLSNRHTFKQGSVTPGTVVFDMSFDPAQDILTEVGIESAKIRWNTGATWAFECICTGHDSSGMNIDEMGTASVTLQINSGITLGSEP